jgi:hypothetical protein
MQELLEIKRIKVTIHSLPSTAIHFSSWHPISCQKSFLPFMESEISLPFSTHPLPFEYSADIRTL